MGALHTEEHEVSQGRNVHGAAMAPPFRNSEIGGSPMGPEGEGGSCSGGVGTSLLGGGSIPGPGCGSWSGGSRSGAGGASGSPPGGACGDGGSGSRTGARLGGWGAGLGSGGTGMAGTSTLMMERMHECGGNLVGDGSRHAHAEGRHSSCRSTSPASWVTTSSGSRFSCCRTPGRRSTARR